MLMLTRYTRMSPDHARIVIYLPDGREVSVSVKHKGPGKIAVGVEGPPDVRVVRAELLAGKGGAKPRRSADAESLT